MKNFPQKQKKFSKILPFIIYLILGGMCGYIGGSIARDIPSDRFALYILIILSVFYLGMLLQMIIHEFGHMVFGLISGYKFVSFRIGNLMLIKKDEKLKLTKYSLYGTGGQCLMSPPSSSEDDFPVILYNLGGCFMNIIFSSFFIVLRFAFKDFPILSACSLIIALVGFVAAILNGVPLSNSSINNDGKNALELIKNPKAKSDLWKQLYVNELMSYGIRLKDMPEYLFKTLPPSEMTNSITATIGAFAVSRYMDMMDFESAVNAGLAILNESTGLAGIHRLSITAELIYCELIGDCDKSKIDLLYTKDVRRFIKSTLKSIPSSSRFAYTYALLYDSNEQSAAKSLSCFEKTAKCYPYPQDIEAERALIKTALEKYNNRT